MKITSTFKKVQSFKDMNETGQGYIFSPEELNPIQKKIKEQNLLMYPLKVKKTILGYMILCNKESRSGVISFNENDLNLLSALGNQAAVALDNARLFKDINKTKKFNESILSSIATGVLTLNSFGEIDSVNEAASKIVKIPINELIGNHYMYTFEKDESIIELIQLSESQNKTKAEINLPFKTASENSIINFSISPRVDENNKTLGSVISLEDITDISKVKNTFKRYVSKQVVDELLGDDTKLKLGGEEREVTVLFSDIRGFTSMSEKLEAEDVVKTLNNYFSDMIDIVFKYNGTLDKILVTS
jgi:Adenylate cyclase, family 3 (some proteins contain HAMP domain)